MILDSSLSSSTEHFFVKVGPSLIKQSGSGHVIHITSVRDIVVSGCLGVLGDSTIVLDLSLSLSTSGGTGMSVGDTCKTWIIPSLFWFQAPGLKND